MKKLKVITRQKIFQTWEYEVEVPDDFVIQNQSLTFQQKGELMDQVWNEGIEGHCWNDDEVRDEEVVDFEWIKA